jgi:hypothetical protein
MAQAAVDMGGGDGKLNLSKRTPSSFSLRVGRACVLVTILDKDPLVINTGGALSILRTPELLCSLVGRLSDCLTVRSMVIEMDENSISGCGSHISGAGLALQLADDNQLRSLYTNARPLVYNSLILGRDKNTNTLLGYKGYANKRSQRSRRDKDDANNSVMNSMTADKDTSKLNDKNNDDNNKNGNTNDMNIITNNSTSTFNESSSTSNYSTSISNNSTSTSNNSTESYEISNSSADSYNNDDNNKEISADRDSIKNSPLRFSRIFKVDLSGTMLRVQAGAIGK